MYAYVYYQVAGWAVTTRGKGSLRCMLSKAKALTLTKSFRSAVLGHNIRFHEESTCLKAAVPEVNSLGSESMVCAETRYEVAHSCTRFPCYLGMEINAKTQWTTTKIVELGN